MDIWTLKVFEAVLAKGSISAAAESVGRTQPRVTRIIKELELELGFPLFNRTGNALVPTSRCLEFAPEARKVVDEMSRLALTARDLQQGARSVVQILAPPHVLFSVLPRIVGEVRKQAPQYRFELAQLKRDSSGRWQAPDHFDIAFGMLPYQLGRVTEHPLGSVEIALIVPRGHPLEKEPLVDLADVARYPYIAFRRAMPLRNYLDRAFEDAGVVPDIVATAPDTIVAFQLVLAGAGIAFGDALTASTFGKDLVSLVHFRGARKTTFGMVVSNDFRNADVESKLIVAARQVLGEAASPFFVQAPADGPTSR